MRREQGFYWVKHSESWFIAFFNDLYWKIIGSEFTYKDESFDEINETKIIPPDAIL